jgi:hypothetical protein
MIHFWIAQTKSFLSHAGSVPTLEDPDKMIGWEHIGLHCMMMGSGASLGAALWIVFKGPAQRTTKDRRLDHTDWTGLCQSNAWSWIGLYYIIIRAKILVKMLLK